MGLPVSNPAHDVWVQDAFQVNPGDFAIAAGGNRPRNAAPPRPARGPQPGASPSGKKVGTGPSAIDSSVSKAAADPNVWTRAVGPALTKDGPGKPGARIKAPLPAGPPTVCTGPDGKKVSIVKSKDGRVAFTHEAPPIQEVTFSGGGGKGAALPGAVWALAQSGVLAQAKEMHGASVGSMTAAMLAAGMTPQDFQDLSDKVDFEKVIKGKDISPIGHDGKGLEELVRKSMKSALGKQIAEYKEKNKGKIDPKIEKILDEMTKKFEGGGGATFMDLRILSKIIPAIKEAVITGTMIGSSDKPKPNEQPGKVKDKKPELKVFSADTEPDMEVAAAVHASAALPPVFKPVDIKMQNGAIGRFEDGGVLNNAPSSDTLGAREVDPVPPKGKMTFVFEDDTAHGIKKGQAAPDRSRFNDFVSGAENSAAEYSKNKTLSERPEDVVIVPLKFTRTNGKTEDYTGLKGTLAFNMKPEDRITLQGMTDKETADFVAKKRQPETRAFDSDAQMLNCVPRGDLATMAASNYAGAKETLKFRDEVVKNVRALEKLAAAGATGQDPRVQDLFKATNALAQSDNERLGFIGRELNRTGKLDKLLASSKNVDGKASTGNSALDAGIAVNEVVEVRAVAKKILDDVLYPKLVREGTKGVEGQMLTQVEDMLRRAKTRKEINRALTIAIDYADDKIDPTGLRGYKGFVKDLRKYLQPVH